MQRADLYSHIIDNMHDGVYFVDVDQRLQLWNKAAELITGYSAEELLGKKCPETPLQHIDEEGRQICKTGCPLHAALIDGEHHQARVFVRHKLGHRIPVRINIYPVVEDGKIIGAIELFSKDSQTVYENDIIEHLSHAAMHDSLTKLPNRRYLESFLEYRLSEYKRFEKPFAILFADIDNFSMFNNDYGHDTGDAVLKNIAASLKSGARSNDLVGRWGGEEFLGIYSIAKADDAAIIAEKFRQLVESAEIVYAGNTMHVTVSVGITVSESDDSFESIIERADKLMYKSKALGKNRVSIG